MIKEICEVDILPLTAKECPFSDYVQMTSRYQCRLKTGIFCRCSLETGNWCPCLKVKESEE